MRKPLEDIKIYIDRRKRIISQIEGQALIVCAQPEANRNGNHEFLFRQSANLYYLTGFEEPESILLLRPGRTPETVMFVRKRDRNLETWNGFRFGPEGAEKVFKIDKAYPIEDFEKEAPHLLIGVDELFYSLYKNRDMDKKVHNVIRSHHELVRRKGYGHLTIHDSHQILAEMRVIKSDLEIENMRKACSIGCGGHLAAMRFVRPGVNEHLVQAVLSHHFMMKGAKREGYNHIVASGNNATTLHYNFNDQVCQNGELLLIDAGAEYNYYTSDITRTFPVNGKFTKHKQEFIKAF
jgi:Xaa-Pro aminopeptidase